MNSTLQANHTKKQPLDKYIFQRTKKKVLKWYTPRAYRLHDLVIFMLLTFGAFLPVRWFHYEYVTHEVLPNMGVITAIAIVMFLLVRSGKLGFVGDAFNRQMIRFAASKTFKRVLIISLALSLYTGIPLYFMERGEFEYQEELQMFDAISIRNAYIRSYIFENTEPVDGKSTYMTYNQLCEREPQTCIMDRSAITYEDYKFTMLNHELPSEEVFDKLNTMSLNESFRYNTNLANNYDFLMSSAMHLANVQSSGWTSHFSTVWFVEQVEAVGLYFLYRRWYLKNTTNKPWLGMFDKSLKLIMYKTPNKDKFYTGKSTKPEDKKPIFIAISLLFMGIGVGMLRIVTDMPVFSTIGLLLIGIAIIYLIKHKRRQKPRLK